MAEKKVTAKITGMKLSDYRRFQKAAADEMHSFSAWAYLQLLKAVRDEKRG